MSYILKLPEIYNQPILLSADEKKDPIQVLKELFFNNNLCELREFLRDVTETCLTTDRPPFSEAEKRSSLLLLKDQIEKCLEAAYLIGSNGNP